MRIVAIITLALLAAACGRQPFVAEGVDKAKVDSYATLTTDSEKNHTVLKGLDRSVFLRKLNGKSLFALNMVQDYPDSALLTPGEHEVEVQYSYLGSYANGCVVFRAEAGKQYIVRHRAIDYAVTFWVEDMATNGKVGHICGFESSENVPVTPAPE